MTDETTINTDQSEETSTLSENEDGSFTYRSGLTEIVIPSSENRLRAIAERLRGTPPTDMAGLTAELIEIVDATADAIAELHIAQT